MSELPTVLVPIVSVAASAVVAIWTTVSNLGSQARNAELQRTHERELGADERDHQLRLAREQRLQERRERTDLDLLNTLARIVWELEGRLSGLPDLVPSIPEIAELHARMGAFASREMNDIFREWWKLYGDLRQDPDQEERSEKVEGLFDLSRQLGDRAREELQT